MFVIIGVSGMLSLPKQRSLKMFILKFVNGVLLALIDYSSCHNTEKGMNNYVKYNDDSHKYCFRRGNNI